MDQSDCGFTAIFNGETLVGWHAVPRLLVPRAPGGREPDTTTEAYRRAAQTACAWTVEEGAIVG